MNWDEYFYQVAKVVASKSKCMSRQIGAVLIRDKSIVSTGYNGPPRGVPHCNVRHFYDMKLFEELRSVDHNITRDKEIKFCPRRILGFKSGKGLEWCIAGHAERNALINAARLGVSTKGCIMVMTCSIPCTPCLVEIINAGISEIVVENLSFYDISAKYLIENSNLKVRVLKRNYRL